MKKYILAIALLCSGNAHAYGMAFLESCHFEYNADYGQSGYIGVYRHISGNYYQYFFSSSSYSWCPSTIDF